MRSLRQDVVAEPSGEHHDRVVRDGSGHGDAAHRAEDTDAARDPSDGGGGGTRENGAVNRSPLWLALAAGCIALTACGGSSSGGGASENLSVSPQNTSLVVGVNRISLALLDQQQNPVHAAGVTARVLNNNGATVGTVALKNIGPEYGGIPVYVGVTKFPDVGQYEFIVSGSRSDGQPVLGHAYVTVAVSGIGVAVGAHVPPVSQAVLGVPGVTLATLDSGIPPDSWHDVTVAQGVAQHRPMVLFFGDPSFCPSKTCGPTHQILEQLCTAYCSRLLFEHIETYYPAGPPGATAHVNPAFSAFGLQTDPWIYFVDSDGVVTDRYEGPVTLQQLTESAQGTLAGRVPAVPLG